MATAPAGTFSSLLRPSFALDAVRRLQSYKPNVDQSFFPARVGDSRAAVLVALTVPRSYADPDPELHVLFTVRSSRLNTFPSEVALPGGRADPEKDAGPADTALRETHEEVGLEPGRCELLVPGGWMAGHVSRNGLLVTPVVALVPPIPDLDLKLNHHEVDRVFYVPLSHFLSASHHSTEKTPNSAARHRFALPGQPPTFGLTAHILVHLAVEVAGCRGDTMPDNGRPVFAAYSTFGSEPADASRWEAVLKMNLRRKKKGENFAEEDKQRQVRDWGKVMGANGGGESGEGEGEKGRL
ncbi:NUDIX hydrolase domain-like protein [Hyaloraphidium curvatum]|nr:NUDIX hydrolase domain-like protein [Hyaloraphidium curvatum]